MPTPQQVRDAVSHEYFAKLVGNWRKGGVSHTSDLPPSLRREIAHCCLGVAERERRAFASLVVESARPAKILDLDKVADDRDREGHPDWLPYLIRLLELTFLGPQAITEDEFRTATFTGRNAPFVFLRRLLGLPRMEQVRPREWGTSRGKYDDTTLERTKLGRTIGKFLIGQPRWPLTPCMVIHSPDLPRGLSALAGDLADDALETVEMSRLPRCLLPASASVPPHRATDLPTIIGQILAFYECAPPPSFLSMSDSELRQGVRKIRRMMAAYPAIFIFDGVRDTGKVLGELRANMIDEPFASLIKNLLFPEPGTARNLADPEIFARNRFVILADGPCEWLAPHARPARVLTPPSNAAAIRFIREDGAYSNTSAVESYYRSNAATQQVTEPHLQLADALTSTGVTALQPPADLAAQLTEELATTHPAWAAALCIVAMTPDVVLEDTLLMLVEKLVAEWRWTNERLGRALPTFFSEDLTQEGLARLRNTLRSVVVAALDDTLMDVAETDRRAQKWRSTQRLVLTFRTTATAKILGAALIGRLSIWDMTRLQRLLAEEALRQHTILVRNADRNDHSSIRNNRRLVQAIHHGLLSVHPSDSTSDVGLHRTLPGDFRERFRRLYTMFYRLLLEAPPHWEMSRVMSAEGVKRDLLLSALDTDRDASARAGLLFDATPRPVLPNWLLGDAKQNATSAAVANDLMLGTCQALLQLSDVSSFADAVAVASHIAHETLEEPDKEVHLAKLDRLRVDADILCARYEAALATIERRLASLNFTVEAFAELLLDARERLVDGIYDGDFPLKYLVEDIPEHVREQLIPLLQRWAEVQATRADLLLTGASRDEVRGASLLTDAYVAFSIADEVRRRVFASDPLGRSYVLNGHSARVQIRVLLLMCRIRREGSLEVRKAASFGLSRRSLETGSTRLLDLVRRRADSLSRTLARYPAERPSMLILESMIGRMRTLGEAGLRSALDYVLDAERQMSWATDRPRVRMRLLFERAKIMRRLAAYSADDANGAIYRGWADYDTQKLRMLADASGSDLWRELATRAELSLTSPERR